jgi:hypothetical protein
MHFMDLLGKKIIQPSSSEWAADSVICKKKDGSIRYCMDYRKLHSVTRIDALPLPRIESCIDQLRGTTFIYCLDMSSGYYQFQIHTDDRHKTAFLPKYELFEHVRLSFGLCNSPEFSQREMQLIMCGLTWAQGLAYLDDVIAIGNSFEDHLRNLTSVIERFQENNLNLSLKNVQYLIKKSFTWEIDIRKGNFNKSRKCGNYQEMAST